MVRGLFASALIAFALVAAAFAACTPSASPGIAESCADIDAGVCFSNDDCPGQRCAIPASADPAVTITCCIPGPRGTADAGTSCSSMNDCASGVCTYTQNGPLCSEACTTDQDCPPVLPSCVVVDGATRFCGLAP